MREQLADGLWLLSHFEPLHGRISWRPSGASGFEPYNEYLIVEHDRALLVDTGVARHGSGVVKDLVSLVGSRRLTIYITRIELDCIGNLAAVLARFPDAEVLTANPISPVSLAPGAPPNTPVHHVPLSGSLAAFGFGRLTVLEPVIRTLGTSWLYDEPTGALFPSDCFCGEIVSQGYSVLARRDDSSMPAVADFRAQLLAKFDWLAHADVTALRRRWDDLFDTIRPQIVAPIHGRPVAGGAIVAPWLALYENAIFGPKPCE